MSIDLKKFKKTLCTLMCAEVSVWQKTEKLISIETPFCFPDGDPYQIYIKEMPSGVLRLTDMGHTLLHLSYSNQTEKFKDGTRGKILEQIKAENFVEELDGEFFIETTLENIASNLLRLGQTLTKINDLTFLNRVRVESTFYEDLQEMLYRVVEENKIQKEYFFEEMENAQNYPIDYRIEGKYEPLFLFGIPNRDKARLTTITLERLLRAKAEFGSLLVFSDQSSIPKQDLARLSNVGGEMIASLAAKEDFERKLKKIAA